MEPRQAAGPIIRARPLLITAASVWIFLALVPGFLPGTYAGAKHTWLRRAVVSVLEAREELHASVVPRSAPTWAQVVAHLVGNFYWGLVVGCLVCVCLHVIRRRREIERRDPGVHACGK